MAKSQTSGIAALALIVVVTLACGSGAYWQSVAEGMGAAANSYSSNTSGNSERVDVCAQYETRSGWSSRYSMTAVKTDGATLNEETGTYGYEPYADYAVIFWEQDQASVLKLQSPTGEISVVGTRAVDQKGRIWKLSDSSLCY